MPRLVYLTAAGRDLADIAERIERASQNRGTAIDFIERLTAYCEHLATLPGLLGRARPELRSGFRSVAFETYLIFFRYRDGAMSRDVLEVIRVLHGARDIEALVGQDGDTPT